jgi:hypothetical protein
MNENELCFSYKPSPQQFEKHDDERVPIINNPTSETILLKITNGKLQIEYL